MKLFRSIRSNWTHTIYACYLGYITQSIVNMFPPLLFVIFQDTFGVSLAQITSLVTINFVVQIVVDVIAGKYADKVGYRPLSAAAPFIAALGISGLAWIPFVTPHPYAGLLICIILNAIGGGLEEVLVSPIVEACPDGKNKESAMGLLHSFYCWGVVSVVLLSTLFLTFCGRENWRILCVLWAIIPLIDTFYFMLVPIAELNEGEEGLSFKELAASGTFWLLIILMLTAGASEQSMSQWASVFAEKGLGVSKTVGDLLGPCMFAILMGISRVIYSKTAPKIDSLKAITACGVLCVLSYLLAVFAPHPMLSLVGCALCGLSVGIFWPGFLSAAALKIPRGGTILFALLAVAGDLGCSGGPTLVGMVAGAFSDNLKWGLLAAVIFPITLIIASTILRKKE